MPYSQFGYVLTAITAQKAEWRPLGQVDVLQSIENAPDPISFGGNRISDVGEPENASDAATKGYVDNSTAPLFILNPTEQLAGSRRPVIALVDLTTGPKTVLLPSDHVEGDRVTVKVRGKANYSCDVIPAGTDTIDLETTYGIHPANDNVSITLVSWGAGWLIVGDSAT